VLDRALLRKLTYVEYSAEEISINQSSCKVMIWYKVV